jgi:WD40 repeat protein
VFSSDGTLMMSASWGSSAQLWFAADGQPIGTRRNHQGGAHRVAISNDNTLLATTQNNNLVRIWQRPSDNIVLHSIEHWGERPRISPDGNLVTPGILHETTLMNPSLRAGLQVLFTSTGEPPGPEIRPPGMSLDSCICSGNQSVAIVSFDEQNGWLSVWHVASAAATLAPVKLPGRPVSVSA